MKPTTRARALSIFGDVPQGREVVTVLEAVRKIRKKAALKAAALKAKTRKKDSADGGSKYFGGRKAKGKKKAKLPTPATDVPKKEKKKDRDSGGRASVHNPFRHSSSLGPTTVHKVRPPSPPPHKTRDHNEKNRWKCHRTGAYAQKCVGVAKDNKGKVLNIKIDRAYKKNYNKAFKAHRTLKRAGKSPK